MKENLRKCIKCGRSPSEDPNITLHRFPRPGIKNTMRCEVWAEYCYPHLAWHSRDFQERLYKDHRMLCSRHFKASSFFNKHLVRSAVPDKECDEVLNKSKRTVTKPETTPLQPLGENQSCEPCPGPSHLPLTEKLTLKFTFEQEATPGPSQVAQFEHCKDFNISTENTGKDEKLIILHKKEQCMYMKYRRHMTRIAKLQKTIKNLKAQEYLNTLVKDESVNKIIQEKISPSFALLLQGQIKNFKRNSKGRRWNTESKITALRMYKRSPTCYRLLRRLICLPTPSTLKTLLGNFKMDVGVNKKLFIVIKKSLKNEDEANKEYILMFDEMSIKKNINYNSKSDKIDGFQDHAEQGRSQNVASHALVFMVAGIRKKVKQPVAYYLSGGSVKGDRLAVLIKDVLKNCFDAGLNIAATVCDMDGVNKRALGILGATAEEPSITVCGRGLVTLFDTPHLLKCFRNNFIKYNIKCTMDITTSEKPGIGIAKWSHIEHLFELDNKNPNFVFAPSLTKYHLNPNTKQKMKVKLAAQVLSHTVAAGIYAKVAQGELPTEAVTTANVLSNMDKLFDSVNSATPDLRRGKPFSTNLKKGSQHFEYFRKMKSFFKTLEFVGSKRAPPFLEGWIWTLNGIEKIWENLSTKHKNVKSLAVRRLQQDPLENLFGCIRGHCGSNSNPTAGQFVAGLKTAILANLPQMNKGNCENDENDVILDSYKSLLAPDTEALKDSTIDIVSDIEPSQHFLENYNEEDVFSSEIQACAYVSGFIIKRNTTDCIDCKNALEGEMNETHTFIEFKEYNDQKKSLKYASKSLMMCVEQCATSVNNFLKNEAHQLKLRENITALLNNSIGFDFLDKCIVHKEKNKMIIIKSIYCICVRRFCTLENRKLAEQASMSALKKKIDILKHK